MLEGRDPAIVPPPIHQGHVEKGQGLAEAEPGGGLGQAVAVLLPVTLRQLEGSVHAVLVPPKGGREREIEEKQQES